MKKLLIINSSAKTINSSSRKLTEAFVDHWKNIYVNPVICFRELGNTDVPHLNEKWIAVAFKPATARTEEEAAALKISDTYIAELHNADVIVIGAPMYNWSIPSALKAYIDQVLRVNETFKINPADARHPYIGLLQNKTLFLLLSRGDDGYEDGEHNAHLNFQSTYLKMVFNMMGVSNTHIIAINGASINKEKFKETINAAQQTIRDVLGKELV
jgi:FMN-dependent NADH-azoreductase